VAPRPRLERGTYRLGEGLSCPGTRGNQDGISPPDLHTALSAGLQGHVSRRDAECRGMPFCPCCSRVDLPCARTCVAFVLARKTRLAGTFQQAASAERPPAHAAAGEHPAPAATPRAGRRPLTASPHRFARNPATTQRNLVRDQPQAKQGQIADSGRLIAESAVWVAACRSASSGVPEPFAIDRIDIDRRLAAGQSPANATRWR
jgi:hypothetical protein